MHRTTPTTAPEHRTRRRRGLGRRVTTTALATVLTAGLGAAYLGAATPSGAVVGGTPTGASQIPWQVSLQDGQGHFCGGSVVSPTVIVTAAHCTEGMSASQITVVAGISSLADTGQTRQVASIVEHPDYADSGVADIAVLNLDRPLEITPTVQAVQLASPSELADAGCVLPKITSGASNSTAMNALANRFDNIVSPSAGPTPTLPCPETFRTSRRERARRASLSPMSMCSVVRKSSYGDAAPTD